MNNQNDHDTYIIPPNFVDTVRREMAQETNEQCRLMQEDYLQFIQ